MAAENGVRDSSSIHRNLCQLCGAVENLMLCAGCRLTYYCGREHQKLDWKIHKNVCLKRMAHQSNGNSEKHADRKGSREPVFSEGLNSLNQHSANVGLSPPEGDLSSLSISTQKVVNTNVGSKDTNPFLRTLGCESTVPQTDVRTSGFVAQPLTAAEAFACETGALDFTEGSSESYILQSDTNALEPHHRTDALQKTVHGSKSKNGTGSFIVAADTASNENGSRNQQVDTRQTYIDVIESRNKMLAEYVIKCLNQYGICVVDNFLGELKGLEILSEVKHLHKTCVFNQGQVVNSTSDSTNQIRGDEITWVDGSEEGCANIGFLVSILDAIMTQCSGKLGNYTIGGRTKGMVACYPGRGTGYVRHVDNPNKDGRCVTSIYYLNRDWDVKTDGGLLRIFPQDEENRVANIEPRFDRLLFFWSDRRNPHEVQPAYKIRYAVTVWYYDAEERKKAVQRYYSRESRSGKKSHLPLTPH